MSDSSLQCPRCGNLLDSQDEGDVKYCSNCGESVSEHIRRSNLPPGHFFLRLTYRPGWYAVIPKMHIFLDGEEVVLENNESREIVLPKGEHQFRLRSVFRRKKFVLDLQKDTELVLGFSRMWGYITVKTEE